MKVRIFDSAFTPYGKSASLRGDNVDVGPTHFEWDGNDRDVNDEECVFYTDGHLKDATSTFISISPKAKKIAWLLEPRHLRVENYGFAKMSHKIFDKILTYDQQLMSECPNAKFYPFGGSSIAFDRWANHAKSKDVCMIMSEKNSLEGHKLRHEIAERFNNEIDFYGWGVGKPIESKFKILKDYRYCVVIENGRTDAYFTEKLIDPISVGCVPIYWGCPSIGEYFSKWGIIKINNLEDLENTLNDKEGYNPYHTLASWTREENWNKAKEYRCTEDWIWNNYPELFGREQKDD